jgi:hypothetical protein
MEAEHREMREPRARLPLVHPKPFQPLEQLACKGGGAVLEVVEDEHPHAPRLAVPLGRKDRTLRVACGLAQRFDDGFEILGRA